MINYIIAILINQVNNIGYATLLLALHFYK